MAQKTKTTLTRAAHEKMVKLKVETAKKGKRDEGNEGGKQKTG